MSPREIPLAWPVAEEEEGETRERPEEEKELWADADRGRLISWIKSGGRVIWFRIHN